VWKLGRRDIKTNRATSTQIHRCYYEEKKVIAHKDSTDCGWEALRARNKGVGFNPSGEGVKKKKTGKGRR